MEIYNGNYIVYCHTNKINNKKYIGITRRTIEERWNYGFGYRKNKHFWQAIQKYGRKNGFYHEVIASNLTKEEAYNFEKLLINKLQTHVPEFGYNLDLGGSGDNEHSVKTRQKISKSKKGKCLSAENPNCKKVQLGGYVFNTVNDCGAYLDISPNLISVWLHRKHKPPRVLVEEGFCFLGEEKIKDFVDRQPRHSVIICEDIEFSSVDKFASVYELSKQTVYNWLSGVHEIPEHFKSKNIHYKPNAIDLLPEKINKLRKEVEGCQNNY